MKVIILLTILSLLFIAGCSATDRGSSLPWSQPESWETQMPAGAEY